MTPRELLRMLTRDLHWPLPDDSLERSAFAYRNTELGLGLHEFRHAEYVYKLRLPDVKRPVFLIDFGSNPINRWFVRKVMINFTTRRRNAEAPLVWQVEQLLFLCLTNEGLKICHFQGRPLLESAMAAISAHADLSLLNWSNREGWAKFFLPSDYKVSRKRQDRSRHDREFFARHSPALADLYDLAIDQPDIPLDEERALTALAQTGHKWAHDRLFMCHLDIALEMAARQFDKWPVKSIPLEDLVSSALRGLDKAVRKEDPTKGYKLDVFARQWMLQQVGRALTDDSFPFRVPAYVYYDSEDGRGLNWLLTNYEPEEALFEQRRSCDRYTFTFEDTLSVADHLLETRRLLLETEPLEQVEQAVGEPGVGAVDDAQMVQYHLSALPQRDRDIILRRLAGAPESPFAPLPTDPNCCAEPLTLKGHLLRLIFGQPPPGSTTAYPSA